MLKVISVVKMLCCCLSLFKKVFRLVMSTRDVKGLEEGTLLRTTRHLSRDVHKSCCIGASGESSRSQKSRVLPNRSLILFYYKVLFYVHMIYCVLFITYEVLILIVEFVYCFCFMLTTSRCVVAK